jgi:hypothetical protein
MLVNEEPEQPILDLYDYLDAEKIETFLEDEGIDLSL